MFAKSTNNNPPPVPIEGVCLNKNMVASGLDVERLGVSGLTFGVQGLRTYHEDRDH